MDSKIKLFNSKIFILLILIPFFEPEYISVGYYGVHKIINYWKLFASMIIVFLYFKQMKISKFILTIMIYEFIIIGATYLNRYGYVRLALNTGLDIISICMFLELGIKNNCKKMIHTILLIFEVLVYSNLITLIIYPDGMYISNRQNYANNWLLGYDNLHIVTILPAIVISLIYSYIDGEKIKFRTKILLICGLTSVFITLSATSTVAILILIIFIMQKNSVFKNTIVFNYLNYCLTYIVLFISIVLLRLQEIFSWFIVDILGKSLTFTGRTNIWDATMYYIKESWIWGYGVEKSLIRTLKNSNQYATHAHNHILEVLYKGGILLLFAFLYLLLIVGRKLMKYKGTMISKILSFSIFLFFLMMLVEARDTMNLYILLIFSYYVDKIVDITDIDKKE